MSNITSSISADIGRRVRAYGLSARDFLLSGRAAVELAFHFGAAMRQKILTTVCQCT
jgi:hypothetical protein